MGTLATLLAGKKIPTSEDRYWVDVEGDIENVDGVLRITTIRVQIHLKVTAEQQADAEACFAGYIARCPAAQSVIGCIRIEDALRLE